MPRLSAIQRRHHETSFLGSELKLVQLDFETWTQLVICGK